MQKIENVDKVVEILVEAAIACSNVMNRGHIIAEKNIRVGDFITHIRRNLTYASCGNEKKMLHEVLTDKDTWEDILTLKNTNRASYKRHSVTNLDYIVFLAQEKLDNQTDKVIELKLRNLENVLDDTENFIKRMQQNNEESSLLLDDFTQLVTEMYN